MADIYNVRTRPGVRIHLHPADIASVLKQPDVVAAFTNEEMKQIIDCIDTELNFREQNNDNNNSQS